MQSLETFLQELYRSSPVAVSCWVITVIKKIYSPEYHFNIIVIDSEWFSFSSTRKWQSQSPFINVVSWLYIVVNFSSSFLVWCAVGIFESSLPLFLTSLVTRFLWRKQYHIFFFASGLPWSSIKNLILSVSNSRKFRFPAIIIFFDLHQMMNSSVDYWAQNLSTWYQSRLRNKRTWLQYK